MSEGLKGVVACHGSLSVALIDAAEQISGVRGALVPVSNSGCDRDLIASRIAEAVGGGPAVVFTDLPSGSCFFAAMLGAREAAGVRVVTGVNLPMLIDFIFHRTLSPAEAAEHAAAAGVKGIRQP